MPMSDETMAREKRLALAKYEGIRARKAAERPDVGDVILYVPVRVSEDGPWLDSSSAALTREMAELDVKRVNEHLPGWAKANPVQRIGRFSLG
jgi:transposase